jgi:hypothetical protein
LYNTLVITSQACERVVGNAFQSMLVVDLSWASVEVRVGNRFGILKDGKFGIIKEK